MTKKFMGAVDIGGTKIQVGIVDAEGIVMKEKCIPTVTGEQKAEKAIVSIVTILEEFCTQMGMTVSSLGGIGIACAGPVNVTKGIIENPYTLPGWEGYPIVKRMEELTGITVKMENDANAALLGEVLLRNLKYHKVLMLTFGTGIGAACWNRGFLYREGEYHPEMGHVIVASYGETCYCRHKGCFESLCSGTAVNKRAQEIGYEDFNYLFQAYKNGEEKAGIFIENFSQEIKNGLWNLSIIFKPDIVILGGGLMKDYFEFVKEIILEDYGSECEDFVYPFQVLPASEQVNPALAGANMILSGHE